MAENLNNLSKTLLAKTIFASLVLTTEKRFCPQNGKKTCQP